MHVEDCNDHNPSFPSTHYEGTISNLALTGTEVLRVKALDKDTGSNAEIVYSFHSGKTFAWSTMLPLLFNNFCIHGKHRYKSCLNI